MLAIIVNFVYFWSFTEDKVWKYNGQADEYIYF